MGFYDPFLCVGPQETPLDANGHTVDFDHSDRRKWTHEVSFGDRFVSAR
jgi:hypothetical protein